MSLSHAKLGSGLCLLVMLHQESQGQTLFFQGLEALGVLMEYGMSNESHVKKLPHVITWQFIKIYLVYLLQPVHQI